MTEPALVLTETDLFELLKLDFDADHLAHLIQRRGLPNIVFRRDGRVIRRFLRSQVLNWLAAEATKRNGNTRGESDQEGKPR